MNEMKHPTNMNHYTYEALKIVLDYARALNGGAEDGNDKEVGAAIQTLETWRNQFDTQE